MESNIVTTKQRVDFIDSAKGIGILLVILGHLIALHSHLEYSIYSFHMPFFFFVSGLFVDPNTNRFMQYTLKKAKRLMIPYAFFCLIGTAVTFLLPVFDNPDLHTALKGILYGDVGNIHVGPIWFLPCLFCVYTLFYPFFHIILEKKNYFFNFVFICGLIISPIIINHIGFQFPFKINVAISALSIFSIGFLSKSEVLNINNNNNKTKMLMIIICLLIVALVPQYIGLIGVVGNSYGKDYLLYFICAICGTVLLLTVSTFIKSKIICYIGKNSLYILGIHAIIIAFYSYCLTKIENKPRIAQDNLNIFEIIIGFIIVSSLSILFCIIYNFFKKLFYKKLNCYRKNRV